ncbi:MAG TPA: hypothetical protein VFV38_02260, partial [Ktedonobacteraceae bacterium]|nr:hypothetical protein [Ktedonobacteraceae bacterium]
SVPGLLGIAAEIAASLLHSLLHNKKEPPLERARECKIVCVLGQNKQKMVKKLEGEEDDQNQTNAISGGTDR